MNRSGALALALMMTSVCALGVPARADEDPAKALAPTYSGAAGELMAALVAPKPDGTADDTTTMLQIRVPLGAAVQVSVNGEPISQKQVGKKGVDSAHGLTDWYYYGVLLRPGPNVIRMLPVGVNGLHGDVFEKTIYGPGEPAQLNASVSNRIVADGKGQAHIVILAKDRWGHPAAPRSTVRAVITKGSVLFTKPAIATTAQGLGNILADQGNAPTIAFTGTLQKGGYLDIPIVAGLQPGDVEIDLSTDGGVTEPVKFHLDADNRKPIVVGIANAGAGSVPGLTGTAPTVVDGANSRLAHIGLYVKGALDDKTVLTAAYDTANWLDDWTNGQGTFNADPLSRPYQTYGDSSSLLTSALSLNHLYFRIDRGSSNLMYGEFNGSTESPNQIGDAGYYRYDLNGLRLHIDGKTTSATIFQAQNRFAFDRVVIDPSGLGVLSQNLRPNIVPGSEQVLLVVKDRTTGAIISQSVLQSNVDYLIDDVAGVLRFLNIPQPYDANFNPQIIVVTYQYQGANVSSETLGGRIDQQVGRAIALGAGYVNDSMGTGNYVLSNQDVTVHLPHDGLITAAHAESSGFAPFAATQFGTGPLSGDAWNLTYAQKFGATAVAATYTDTSLGFTSPFGGLASPGLQAYNIIASHKIGTTGSLEFATQAETQNGASGQNAGSQTALRYHRNFSKKFGALVGIQHVTSNTIAPPADTQSPAPAPPAPAAAAGPLAQSNTQYELGGTWTPNTRFDLLLDHIGGFGQEANVLYPPQTRVEAGWRSGAGRLYLRELWTQSPSGALNSNLGQNPNVSILAPSGTTAITEFGFQRQISPAMTLDTGLIDSVSPTGHSLYWGDTLKEHINLGKAFALTAGFQAADPITETGTPAGFAAYDAELAYANPAGLRAAGSWQQRDGSGSGSSLAFGVSGPIAPDLSVLGSDLLAASSDALSHNLRVGLAWRPLNTRGAALVEYENSGSSGNIYGTNTTNLIAADALIRPVHDLDIAGRVAYKLNGDGFYAAHSLFYGVRFDEHLDSRFDVGTEYDAAVIPGIANAASNSFAAELGFSLSPASRLGLGYSFQGSIDPTLTNAPNRRGVYVSATSAIDSIFAWGKK